MQTLNELDRKTFVEMEFYMSESQSRRFLYIYAGLAAGVIGLGIFFSLKLGSQPSTTPQIALNYFADETELADAIYTRLNTELRKSQIYVLGVEPSHVEHVQLWLEFLKKTQTNPELMVHNFLIDKDLFDDTKEELRSHLSTFQSVHFQSQWPSFVNALETLTKDNQKTVIIVPNIYSFKILRSSPFGALSSQGISKVKMIHLTASFFPEKPEDLSKMMFPCKSEESDGEGTARLGCLIQNKAATVRRKIKPGQEMIGLMDLIGENDYLIMLKKR